MAPPANAPSSDSSFFFGTITAYNAVIMSPARKEEYRGFEQGPIRPPSEAYSLLIRVTRNCPWNKCTFCPVYKGSRFSKRPVEHVTCDIDAVGRHLAALRKLEGEGARGPDARMREYADGLDSGDLRAFEAALRWIASGMESVFLQDADSLVIGPKDMLTILHRLREHFPWVSRITTYARSRTAHRISQEEMAALAGAGLNRIHIGMESGSDEVLQRVRKGVTKEQHIAAGRRVLEAGIELSEYVMPGLGGRELSEAHATETADALNRINPHFIRLRTLAVPKMAPISEDLRAGRFEKPTDVETSREILLFLQSLQGIDSYVKSDHILNLFQEIDGKLPEDKDAMTSVIERFLNMTASRQVVFQVGRRLGRLQRLADCDDPRLVAPVEAVIVQHGITPENVDDFVDSMMRRFI